MRINQKEVFRYLGYGTAIPDEKTMALIEEGEREITLCVNAKHLYRTFDLQLLDGDRVDFTGFQATSKNLSKNLQDCSKVILFAATLGPAVDQLIRRYNRTQISKAVVLQAISAACIEGYCNEINEVIRQEYRKKGLFLRPRFSPGYGDFSIRHQKDILNILECPKRIGLTLTESLVMMPSKSVTAIIGISHRDQSCDDQGCEVCEKKDCAYKRG